MANVNRDGMSYLTVRVSFDLRERFAAFCDTLGMTPSQVIGLFVQYYIQTNDSSVCFVSDSTQLCTAEKTKIVAIWLSEQQRKQFVSIAQPNMSVLIRGYMQNCIIHGIPHKIICYLNGNAALREILQQQIVVLRSIAQQISDDSIDDVTAKEISEKLILVCSNLEDVVDNI